MHGPSWVALRLFASALAFEVQHQGTAAAATVAAATAAAATAAATTTAAGWLRSHNFVRQFAEVSVHLSKLSAAQQQQWWQQQSPVSSLRG